MKWRALVALILMSLRTPPASAQDSAARHSLALHVPFFIPFFHHRHQAGRTLNALPDSTEVVSVEAGYDGNFNSADLARDESSSVTLVITPTSRIELEGDLDFWSSEAAPGSSIIEGRGDAHLRFQWTAISAHPDHLAIAVAYIAKLPTANRGSLGSGRMDHRLLIPVSAAFRGLQIDAYAGVDVDGTPTGPIWGGEGAVSVTRSLSHDVFVHTGFSGQSIDTDQPAGRYLSGGITWQLRPLVALDLGARAGLGPHTPAFGLTAGITTAIVTR